ncbi:hypothetical protein [Bradyrhizobium neotropicale]|uniref:hypothetical protein n=1 Tax=Bradyrhizobium neotropicale TaxID=1497615 RepID=UPI00191B98D6|nr:hypothetical protein [Bradyrhizobium neotropicale]
MVRVLVVAEGLSAGPAAPPMLSPDVADIVDVLRFQNSDAACLYKRRDAHSNGSDLQSI